jgi:hypothetical protein
LTTKHSPQEFRDSARDHRNSAEDIHKHEGSVDDIVAALWAANKGDLMVRLNDIHTGWKDRVDQMRGRIGDMADYMDLCSYHLGQRDQENTSWLPPLPPP